MAVPRFRITERQVLLLLLVASCLGFAGAFLVAGFRERGTRLERTTQPRVRWTPVAEAAEERPLAEVFAEYFDPSLMSLPNPHGFSSPMWQHTAEPPARAFEPPAALALLDPPPIQELPALLPALTTPDELQEGVQKLSASLSDGPVIDASDIPVAGTRSTMSIEGDLEGRNLLEPASLPSPTAESGLRRTRIRLAVAPDGRVRYATLERSCGNEAVDSMALEFARRLRFDPVSSADPLAVQWGILKIIWATVPKSQ